MRPSAATTRGSSITNAKATANPSSKIAACSSTPRAISLPGEELGYDYEIGRDKDDPPNADEIYACRCGSPKCRGTMLWPPKRTETRKAPQAGGRSARAVGRKPSGAAERSRRARLIDQLAARGFAVADDFIDAGLLADLRARCLELRAAGALRPARIGRDQQQKVVPEVRGDFIAWLSQPERDAEQLLLGKLEELRAALNRALMAGLEDFQGHFARVPERRRVRAALRPARGQRCACNLRCAVPQRRLAAGRRRAAAYLHRRRAQ